MKYLMLVAGILCGCFVSVTHGASIFELRSANHGSTDPPGDIIEFGLLNDGATEKLIVEIRAYELSQNDEDANATPELVQAAARDGEFLLKQEIDTTAESPIASVSIIVPYDSMQLSPGLHKIAYELTVLRDGQIEVISATSASFIAVEETQKEEILRQFMIKKEMIMRSEKVVEVMRNGDVKIEPREVRTSVPIPTSKENAVKSRYPSKGSFSPEFNDPTRRVQMVTGDGRVLSGTIQPPDKFGNIGVMSDDASIRRVDASNIEELAILSAPNLGVPLDIEKKAYITALKQRPWFARPHLPIYFATNRNLVDATAADSSRYGNVVAEMRYGTCQVSMPSPDFHRKGGLERPKWWEKADPEKHVLVEHVQELEKATIIEAMSNVLNNEFDDDLLVYVHGFANTFENAILTGARLKHDTEFSGPVLVYCWPSEGKQWDWVNPAGPYKRDEDRAELCYQRFADLLRDLCEEQSKTGSSKIHILAHSMGNRIVVESMKLLSQQLANGAKPFGHVVLAAPDIGADAFAKNSNALFERSDDVTLYYCEDDNALQLSQTFHSEPRLGQSRTLRNGLDNVDCRNANTSWIGHGYIVDRDVLLIDLYLLLMKDQRPPQRHPPLNERADMGAKYWFFP